MGLRVANPGSGFSIYRSRSLGHEMARQVLRGLYIALPFGLRSAPFIFDSIATMVEWILASNNYQVSDLVHYLDDFITAGPADTDVCARNLSIALQVCTSLGIPLHPGKCVGPSTNLVVLGIELDSVNQIARLPHDKLSKLLQLIRTWVTRQWCLRRELESLIGHLHHAAKVVWPGRAFLRRMIGLLCCFRHGNHPIRLNVEFHLDLKWWLQFLESWNGVSFWLYPGMTAAASMEVTSDAAGALSYGAFFNHEWFNGLWFKGQIQLSIAYKELFPVVVAMCGVIIGLNSMSCSDLTMKRWSQSLIREPPKSLVSCTFCAVF